MVGVVVAVGVVVGVGVVVAVAVGVVVVVAVGVAVGVVVGVGVVVAVGVVVVVISPMSASRLLIAIQKRGCNATDLRDAAHEAHHALFLKLRSPWERERIHEALLKRARRDSQKQRIALTFNEMLIIYELDARAVEWTICERFGIEYDLDKWADIMWWETAKNMRICLPSIEQVAEAITLRKGLIRTRLYANHVEALAKQARRS